jgi:hypothetical protein
MSRLPVTANTTCDVYHAGGTAPPNPPDIAGVPINLFGHFTNIKPPGIAATPPFGTYTHVALVPVDVDLRDPTATGAGPDTLYVPDKNGVPYRVVWIERVGRGTSVDMLRVHLNRVVYAPPNANL